jgi:hypothetical protein
MKTDRRRLAVALALSFLVYAVPLVGPHGGWPVAEVLLQGFRGQHDRVWAAENVAVVLLVQALVCFWLIFWVPRRFGKLVSLLAIPGAYVALSVGLMYLVPLSRLVEPDDAPEHVTFGEECRLEGKWLALSGSEGRALVSQARTEAVLRATQDSGYWLVRFPGCKLEEIPLPKNTSDQAYAPIALARGGRTLLYTTARRGKAYQETGALIDGRLVPLKPFSGDDLSGLSQPRLAPDGSAIAWIDHKPGELGQVRVAALGSKGLRDLSRFALAGLGPGTYELIDASAGARELLLLRDLKEFLFVSAEGKLLSTLVPEAGLRAGLGTIRILSSGGLGLRDYLVWEGYREEGRYVVQWRTGGSLVAREIPKGRSVSSADLSADGKFVAVSTAPAVSIRRIEDSVVIWSSDGKEVFRKRLDPYTRAPVAFFAANLVAYSQGDRPGHGVTHVLRLW